MLQQDSLKHLDGLPAGWREDEPNGTDAGDGLVVCLNVTRLRSRSGLLQAGEHLARLP